MQKSLVILVFRLASTLTMCLCLCGCARDAIKSDLYGNYISDYSVAHEHLALMADGKFVQKVKIKATGKTYESHGTWKYNPKQYGQDVLLDENYMGVLNNFGNAINKNFTKKSRGDTWIQVYYDSPDSVRIGSYEYDGQYVKVPSSGTPTKNGVI